MKWINYISAVGFLKKIVTRTKQKNPNNETKDGVGTFNLEQSFSWVKVYLKPRAGLKHQLQWYPLKSLFVPVLTPHTKSKSCHRLQAKCMWPNQDDTKVTHTACVTASSAWGTSQGDPSSRSHSRQAGHSEEKGQEGKERKTKQTNKWVGKTRPQTPPSAPQTNEGR